MSREYRISWNENQLRRLNSAVRKYNNALRRAAKADPLAHIYLPQEVSYKELKSSITTARALKSTVNRLTRVTRPKALEPVQQQDGSIVTRYERHEYAVLRSVRERKKSMRAKAEGVVQPTAGAGNLKQAALSRDTRPVSTLGAGAIRRFIETQSRQLNMSNEEQVRRYYTNYMKALWSVFGGFPEHDADIEHIEEIILTMAKNDWKALVKSIEDAPSISYIYGPQEREAKMKKILGYWTNVRAV